MRRRLGLLAALAGLVGTALAATPAHAAHSGVPPWTSGLTVQSPTELRISGVAAEIARHAAETVCPSPTEWPGVATELDFAADVAGVAEIGGSLMILRPEICSLVDDFIGSPRREGQKVCQTGMRTEHRTEYRQERYRVTVRKRVRVGGRLRWMRVQVWRTRRVPVSVAVQVPVMGTCRLYAATLEAVGTVSHEAIHLAGVEDEPASECFGMQLVALVANRLGATAQFAVEMANDYPALVYVPFVTEFPEYASGECRDGGRLDLFPERAGWPVPIGARASAFPQVDGVLPRTAARRRDLVADPVAALNDVRLP